MIFKYKRLVFVCVIFAVIGGYLFLVNPVSYWFTPKCPVKLLTGFNCPACGIQRFFHALLHGNIMKAFAYNYYLAYTLPYMSLFIICWVMKEGKYKKRLGYIIENRHAVWFYVISFFAWFIIRNILHI